MWNENFATAIKTERYRCINTLSHRCLATEIHNNFSKYKKILRKKYET